MMDELGLEMDKLRSNYPELFTAEASVKGQQMCVERLADAIRSFSKEAAKLYGSVNLLASALASEQASRKRRRGLAGRVRGFLYERTG